MTRRNLPGSRKRSSRNVRDLMRRRRRRPSSSRSETRRFPPRFQSGLGFVLVVFLLTAVFLGLRLYRGRVLIENSRVTVAVQFLSAGAAEAGVYLVTFDPRAESLGSLGLPPDTVIEAAGGYGPWRVESLYPLGQMDLKGGELLRRSLESFFGVGVDGWLVTDRSDFSFERFTLRSRLRQIIGEALLGQTSTNLNLWDLTWLWLALSSVDASGTTWIDLSQSGALGKEQQPDGGKILVADVALLDRFTQGLFSQNLLVEEGAAVAILNGTSERGLGKGAARLIRNMGGNVIAVSDHPRRQEFTTIVVSDKLSTESFTVALLAKTFLASRVSEGRTSEQRADILLTIGEDYAKYLSEP